MGRRYHSRGSVAVGTDKSAVSLISAATIRPRLYDLIIGCVATPADAATNWAVQRFTADGTGTAFTPIALDPADPAPLATSKSNYTVEPTVTAATFLFQASINQRATFRWVAAPGGELVAPATAANGLVVKSASSTVTTTHECGIWFEE